MGVGAAELVAGAFPPGSITGAPKVRAMQIIEELEPVARGPYCGSIGHVSACGHAAFNVAIRTACITGPAGEAIGAPPGEFARERGATLDYSVGAGIVVESDPEAEWEETLAKAGAILRIAGGLEGTA